MFSLEYVRGREVQTEGSETQTKVNILMVEYSSTTLLCKTTKTSYTLHYQAASYSMRRL